MLGLRTPPRRWQKHLFDKLKENGFLQDERDPCLFVKLVCMWTTLLTVRPSELTKNLLQELSKDMTMRWGDRTLSRHTELPVWISMRQPKPLEFDVTEAARTAP